MESWMKYFLLLIVGFAAGVLAQTLDSPGWQWPLFALGLGIAAAFLGIAVLIQHFER